MKNTSILIVDDHTLVAEACSASLQAVGDFTITGIFTEPQKAIDFAKDSRPDIILLDINLPGASGFDLVGQFNKYAPLSRVIGFSMHSQPVYARKMIRLGARGYLAKNATVKELAEAVRIVANGGIYLSRQMREQMVMQSLEPEDGGNTIESLTFRELQILKLINEGKYSREIAVAFGISQKTVEVHRHNILKKLQVKNTTSALAQYNLQRY